MKKKINNLLKVLVVSSVITLGACTTAPKQQVSSLLLPSYVEKNIGKEVLIFGHKNPDMDSYGSAIAYSELLNNLGIQAKPVALGNPNSETKFALEYFGVEKIDVVNSIKDEKEVVLVDHNEIAQSINNLENGTILEVVDHHRIGLKTATAIDMSVEEIGSAASIVYKKALMYNMDLSRKSQGMLLSAILSDTLLHKSPTTTPQDIEITKELADKLDVDYQQYGMELLKAGTQLDGKTVEDIYVSDMKAYTFNSQQGTIGQVNTVSTEDVLKQKTELKEFMTDYMNKNNQKFATLMITNILDKNSTLLVVGDKTLFNKAFGLEVNNDVVFLDDVVSRKRQVIPALEKVTL